MSIKNFSLVQFLTIVLLMSFTYTGKVFANEEKNCISTGGIAQNFSNSCADYCWYVRDVNNATCAKHVTEGCDCGPKKCFNGKYCEDNSRKATK